MVAEKIEVQRRRSDLRYTILHEPHAQLQNRQAPWAAELGGKLDTHPLLAAEALGQVAKGPRSSQGVDGGGKMMA